jgi:hypothetical protein
MSEGVSLTADAFLFVNEKFSDFGIHLCEPSR